MIALQYNESSKLKYVYCIQPVSASIVIDRSKTSDLLLLELGKVALVLSSRSILARHFHISYICKN